MSALTRFLLAPLVVLALAAPAAAQVWSYTDSAGNTTTSDHVPTRILAHSWAAAGLIAYGIRPVAIYADGPVAEDPALRGVDLAGIEIVGEVWGEMNIEKVAALQPDLIVSEYWPFEKTYSGFESGAEGKNAPVLKLAPLVGITQGDSVVTMIEEYGALAKSLGVDIEGPALAARKVDFEEAVTAFQAAIAAKPGLTAMAVWANAESLYVAAPAGASELLDMQRWGLDLVDPEDPADRGYWEILSWEQADKYQPDLLMVDDRQSTTRATAEAQPMWTLLKAAAADQVADWPAYWIRSYEAYARELRELTAAITAADPAVSD
jgi:iron complex transport system substrate-binding protein